MLQASYTDKLKALKDRLGMDFIEKRLFIEANLWKCVRKKGIICKYSAPIMGLLKFIMRATGLYQRSYHEFLNIELVHNSILIPGLPSAFDGYRIMHISDTHADLDPALTPVIIKMINAVDYDLCVHTGDYQDLASSDGTMAVAETKKILESIDAPAYGVLGNHDILNLAADLESNGLRLLLNENITIECEGKKIYIAGVDDPFIYETHDLPTASKGIPSDAISILLSHSPQIYADAQSHGFDFMLSGHSHGGQLCLPGGIPIINHSLNPRKMISGSWKHKNMGGYTSRGTGSCGLPLRLFCRPEITIHTLRG